MSYGVWKKRGKGWSSFEIDGCDDWRWDRIPESRRKHLRKRAMKEGMNFPLGLDPSYVVWYIGQIDRGRTVVSVNTMSDHCLYIAFRGEEEKEKALRANGSLNLKGERIPLVDDRLFT